MKPTNENSSTSARHTVRTWRQRIGVGADFPLHSPNDVERAMEAEIAELRAHPMPTRQAAAAVRVRLLELITFDSKLVSGNHLARRAADVLALQPAAEQERGAAVSKMSGALAEVGKEISHHDKGE